MAATVAAAPAVIVAAGVVQWFHLGSVGRITTVIIQPRICRSDHDGAVQNIIHGRANTPLCAPGFRCLFSMR